MPTFAFTLEYDGTDFEGWQRQPAGHRSVQGELERALGEIVGHQVTVRGAGRTDAGVHAEGQLASAALETSLDAATLRRASNAHLPPDVVVRQVRPAPDGWNPRFAATSKHYRYQIWNGADRSPLRARRFAPVPQPLDLEVMASAAGSLEGRHDFAAFQASGSAVTDTVRTLFRLSVAGRGGGEVFVDAVGDGFLRHMVRTLAGTLIEVGLGSRAPDSVAKLLEGRDRTQAGPTAPSRGLVLVRVEVPEAPGGEGGPRGGLRRLA